ncbi:MAG: glycosyltransferase family 4 protein [Planctomycetota bacterium]|nr:glycosyltransferase family 4 protein [Planctomycetota bacterium]
MKIVYLANTRIPSRVASSVHVMKMCQALAHNGHDVVLMNPRNSDLEDNVDDVFDYYGVDRCFRLVTLPAPRHKFARLLRYDSFVNWKVRREQPDLVYARCHGLYLYRLERIGLPFVLESHVVTREQAALRRIYASPHFRRLVVISNALKQLYLDELQLPESSITVAHDGADESKCQSPIAGRCSQLIVGYVGNLFAGRGIELIVELAERCPFADFRLLGGHAEDITRWQTELTERQLENITLHGFVPPSQTDEFRQSCDVLIAPYQQKVMTAGDQPFDTSQWMSPLKVFEYMAAGRAIIASDMPSLREVLRPDDTAILCRPDCVDEWALAIRRLFEDATLRRTLGTSARDEFRRHYTWHSRARNILDSAIQPSADAGEIRAA